MTGLQISPGTCLYFFWVARGISYQNRKDDLGELIPIYRMPLTIGSDNSLKLVAEITQKLAKELNIQCSLHEALQAKSSENLKEWIETYNRF